MPSTRVWHLSDTHTYHKELSIPENIDIVIHTGDVSKSRDSIKSMGEVNDFANWYGSLPIPHKIYVPGNHDLIMSSPSIASGIFRGKAHVLDNQFIEIRGLSFFGGPFFKQCSCGAFQITNEMLADLLANAHVPTSDLDFFLCHGPPMGHLDVAEGGERIGSRAIDDFITNKEPSLTLFGHVHDPRDPSVKNFGIETHTNGKTLLVNSACWDYHRNFLHGGTVIEIVDSGSYRTIYTSQYPSTVFLKD